MHTPGGESLVVALESIHVEKVQTSLAVQLFAPAAEAFGLNDASYERHPWAAGCE